MTPQQFLKIQTTHRQAIAAIQQQIDEAYDEALKCPMPPMERLRPAEPRDVVVNAIFWYPADGPREETYWKIVEEVLRPTDAFKAYHAEDGCRYGLDGAYVEIT